jgi:Fic family protein
MAPVDHSHGHEAALSDEADPLYEPLQGIDEWAAVAVDSQAWVDALSRITNAQHDAPMWAAMVDRGMRLAAAYQSGALDGLYAGDPDLVLALLRGDARIESVDEGIRPHVRANAEALAFAAQELVTEGSIRRIHELACQPQPTHAVRVDDRVQDHVLAAGDYKHHPNHLLDGHGHWHPTVPVALIESEMAALIGHVRSPEFAALHPVAQAAWMHHAVLHIQPFADGNGRVARALAGGRLLQTATVPYLPDAAQPPTSPAEAVEAMWRAASTLIDLVASLPREGPALERWAREEVVAEELRRQLVPALTEAVGRYAGGRADLTGAQVSPGPVLLVSVEPGADETITVDAHRDGPALLTATEAGLRLEAGDPLGPWLDRVVSTLALRVAAELE